MADPAQTVTAVDRDRPAVPRGFEVGATLGRYRIMSRLGEGGMGVVYEAHDAELDRRVALKVLRHRGDTRGTLLVREARAMARLAHENVVPVFDAGVLGDEVYVAMELVPGQSLDAWCEQKRRTWRELIDVFIQGGRGLAAAHEAGIVHRDVKPGNLLVGDDGRVRVADFGLARSADESTADAGAGTPAFMAPEQRDGAAADALSDQYSLALAFRALLGDAEGRIPAALRRTLRRASADDRTARFASVAELLGELERIRRRDRQRRGAILAGVAIVATGVGGYAFAASRTPAMIEPCGPATERLAGVWDPTQRTAIAAKFAAADRALGAGTATMIAPHLDRHTQTWLVERTHACRQRDALLPRRYACLDRVLDETRALTELFGKQPTPAIVRGAVAAVLDLPRPESCRDELALEAAMPLPADPGARERITKLREEIDRAAAYRRTGEYKTGIALAAELPERARVLRYAPVEAEALLVAGELEDWGGDPTKAAALYQDAMLAAGRAGDDMRLATAAAGRVFALGALGQGERALEAGTVAEAQATRSRSPAILGLVHNNLGATYFRMSQLDLAARELEHALELRESAFGTDHPAVASTLSNLGAVRRAERKFAEAEKLHRRALDIKRRVLGPDHPDVAQSLTNLAAVLSARGDHAGAFELEEDALARLTRAMGPETVQVAQSLNNLGSYAAADGKWADAARVLERAAKVFRAVLPGGHPNLAGTLASLGEAYVHLGRAEDAIAVVEEAVRIHEAAKSPPVELAHAQYSLGEALLATKRDRTRACELVTHARDAYRTAEAAKWTNQAEALLASGCRR